MHCERSQFGTLSLLIEFLCLLQVLNILDPSLHTVNQMLAVKVTNTTSIS